MRPQRDADERLRDDDPPEPDFEAPPLFFAEPEAPPEDRADAPPFVDADVFEAADFDADLPPLFEPPPVDPLCFEAEAERVPPPEDALLLRPFDEPLLADFAAPPELLLADLDAEDPDRVDEALFDDDDFFAAAEPPFEAALFFAADDRDDDPPDEDLDELFEPDRFAPPPMPAPTSPAMSAAVAAAPITAPFAAPVASSVTTFAASSSTLLTVFVADERREPDVLLFVFAAILVASFFC